ncbi:DUF4189 domain-containing protein [Mycolicibacterium mucogenicum]|uniref:DUF4189 domain-containing protein n=1 Tax=Mycolicibacterium mucogenicum TaxID=56689 RepID=UPI002269B062|nr:DUF4189 domain-containing protein [Mycolicibacterium mucogenicum]MCX8559826.1 DUF4189 domain-containing protein [Mycolicibacterium mucogenicum]
MFRTLALAIFAAALFAPATAHADNIDFGTNQDACQAAAHQANAGGNASAFCFQTGPGHYSLTFERRQAQTYSPRPVVVPPGPAVTVASNDYVALSVSTMNASTSWYATAPSQDMADQLALAACSNSGNTGCAVATRAHDECAAVGVAESGQFIGGWGPTAAAAANGAMNAAPGVRIIGTRCANQPAN